MKLHLGCGRRKLPEYINIDARIGVGADFVCDVGDLPYRDEEADIIYACHVLEHIPRPMTLRVLGEWRRVLKPGGILRIAVPSFGALARLYDEGVSLWRIIGPVCGRQDYAENTHFTIWDYDYLAWHLTEAGFHSVRPWASDWPPRGWDDYSLAVIDGTPISLNLEASRA